MQEEERMSGALQENVLTLLCFGADTCKIIRNSVTSKLFESSIYRDIASHAIDFIDQFQQPIGEHLPDVLEHVLKGDDKRKATAYEKVMDNLFMAKDSINSEYVISRLNEFVRGQSIKAAIVKAVEAIERNDIVSAELELTKGMKAQAVSFEGGTVFSDPEQSLKFLNHQEESFMTGIHELDKRDIGPRRKELFLIIAPPKKGKSWGLIQIGKWSILQRLKVLHITLEMSEEKVAQRYAQAFFSITKREAAVKLPRFKRDELGRLDEVLYDEVIRPTMADSDIRAKLTSRIKRDFRKRPPLIIKQFPTGSLTTNGLKAYLDGLERFQNFVPDIIIMDYPDLMQLDSNNLRVDTGRIYKEIRGIAVERNVAVVAASQGNRTAATAKVITDSMVAEDFSKIATADNVITYNQTDQEKALGLARIFVSNGRNDEDKFVVLVSQNYATGQFCLDSTMMLNDYWRQVDMMSGKGDPDEED